MATIHLLLYLVLVTHGLAALVWWAAGSWLEMSRMAARHWLAAGLLNGAALCVMTLNEGRSGTALALLGCLIVALGQIFMRRGLQVFLRRPLTDRSHLTLAIGLTLFSMVVCLPLGWKTAGIIVSCVFMVLILLRTAQECFAALRREFHVGTAWTHTAMMGSGTLLFTAIAVRELLADSITPLYTESATLQASLVLISVSLSVLANFVLGYLVVRRLVQRLEHLSHHDALTSLLNRRAIEAALEREAQRLHRFGEPFTLIMIDIDHFKRINDRIGHAAGDAVLVAVSHCLMEHARGLDRVARFGGEEFCVLLPHTLHEGGSQAAERLRQAISRINVPWGDEQVTVTISCGVATACDPMEALPSVVRRADQALYQAKAEGRNTVVCSPPTTAAAPVATPLTAM